MIPIVRRDLLALGAALRPRASCVAQQCNPLRRALRARQQLGDRHAHAGGAADQEHPASRQQGDRPEVLVRVDVPTVAEQGGPGFEMTQSYGLLAPASLPAAAADKLASGASKAIKAPAAGERLATDTAQAVGNTPAEFARFIAQEQARWKPVIARAKIKPD